MLISKSKAKSLGVAVDITLDGEHDDFLGALVETLKSNGKVEEAYADTAFQLVASYTAAVGAMMFNNKDRQKLTHKIVTFINDMKTFAERGD